MKRPFILFLSLITIGFPPLLALSDSAPATAKTQAVKSTSHTIGNVSFQTPKGWVKASSDQDHVIIDNRRSIDGRRNVAPKGSYRLSAWVHDEDLDGLVSKITTEQELGSKTVKGEKLTIGGKPAARIYQTYEEGFSGSVITLIATGKKQTTKIVTFYSDSQTAKQGMQVHRTIRVVQ